MLRATMTNALRAYRKRTEIKIMRVDNYEPIKEFDFQKESKQNINNNLIYN